MKCNRLSQQKYLAQTVGWLCLGLPLAGMAPAAWAQNVDVGNLGDRGFRIEGAAASDAAGSSVSGAGDVNGDGLADLIVGASGADPGGINGAGESYVVFGKANDVTVDLAQLGTDGFRIKGTYVFGRIGDSVSGAGDVNGDGLADLIMGARGGGDTATGECYVVFGKADSTMVDLANLGSSGFQIDGINPGDQLGSSVSGAGDVNGDGLTDLIVGANAADPGNRTGAGISFVVFGKVDSAPVELANLGAGGFRIDGINPGDQSGYSVSGAGDVNGDGLADLIVGAPTADPGNRNDAGESYVVFGKADSTTVDLANLGAGGFRIDGINPGDQSGYSVSGAGDVNGDGLADLIVGSLEASPGGNYRAGISFVVFGKVDSATVELVNLSTGGFRIDGVEPNGLSGISVAGAGDVNADGLADLILGAPGVDVGGVDAAGRSYVLFGKSDSTTVELANLSTGGFRIDGIQVQSYLGSSVSGAGDVNGDGLADVIVSASGTDSSAGGNSGATYVVFSASVPLLSSTVHAHSANDNSPRTAFGVTGDGSNDSTPDARAWIDFADGNDLLNDASTEFMTLTRSSGAMPSSGANVSWRLQTTRQNWTSAEVRFKYLDSDLLVANENQLRIVFSSNGNAPYTPMASVVNPTDNTISANILQPGFYYLGQADLPDEIFSHSFE